MAKTAIFASVGKVSSAIANRRALTDNARFKLPKQIFATSNRPVCTHFFAKFSQIVSDCMERMHRNASSILSSAMKMLKSNISFLLESPMFSIPLKLLRVCRSIWPFLSVIYELKKAEKCSTLISQ